MDPPAPAHTISKSDRSSGSWYTVYDGSSRPPPPSLKGAGIWSKIRIELKMDDRIAGSMEPPNFRCSLVIWSGPAAFFSRRE